MPVLGRTEADPALLAREVIALAGAEHAPRIAGMIAGAPELTVGEKVEALAEADFRVDFTDVQLLQRSLIIATTHRYFLRRQARGLRPLIARRYY